MAKDPTLATDWQIIPLDAALDVPHFSQQVTLDGQVWTLTFLWSSQAALWSMSLSDETETTVYKAGQPVVLNQPLCPGVLNGLFLAQSKTPLQGVQRDLADLTLYYIPAQAYAEILIAQGKLSPDPPPGA
jgi:hypothetical protein